MVKRKFFAAYGSHMNVVHMSRICPESYVFGWGNINDFVLEFRTLENITNSEDDKVPVVLWSITKDDEIDLELSVDLEIYRKAELNVILTDVNEMVAPNNATYYREGVKAWVYIMKEGNISPNKTPSSELFQTILEGYRQHNIKTKPLSTAVVMAGNNK